MVREFSDDQRSFCTQRKLQGATLAQIHQEYEHWWPMPTWGIVNPPPPSDRCLRLWVAKLNAKKTLQDLRKKRKSSIEGVVSVCTPANIARVNFLTLKMFWLLFNRSAVPNLQRASSMSSTTLMSALSRGLFSTWNLTFSSASARTEAISRARSSSPELGKISPNKC